MKVWVAMSGGVDSSLAARRMKDTYKACEGVMLRMNIPGSRQDQSADIEDARRVAAALDIPFHLIDAGECFEACVIRRFISTYEAGGTPNPCVDCNRSMKFGLLWEKAAEAGCDLLATGHYARVEKDEKSGRYLLKKALDPRKDQSYMLYGLSQEQLAHAAFPLGSMTKDDARREAENAGLVTARKKDSQDICFVPDGNYGAFMEQYTGKTYPPGNFVTADGRILGRHKGIIHYTIGQRKGLGIASEAPLFVIRIDPEENTVVLSHGEGLFTRTVMADHINLISVRDITEPLRVTAKIRYRHEAKPATVIREGDRLHIEFDEPQRAVTRGQAAVLYDGDTVVGGGTIC